MPVDEGVVCFEGEIGRVPILRACGRPEPHRVDWNGS